MCGVTGRNSHRVPSGALSVFTPADTESRENRAAGRPSAPAEGVSAKYARRTRRGSRRSPFDQRSAGARCPRSRIAGTTTPRSSRSNRIPRPIPRRKRRPLTSEGVVSDAAWTSMASRLFSLSLSLPPAPPRGAVPLLSLVGEYTYRFAHSTGARTRA